MERGESKGLRNPLHYSKLPTSLSSVGFYERRFSADDHLKIIAMRNSKVDSPRKLTPSTPSRYADEDDDEDDNEDLADVSEGVCGGCFDIKLSKSAVNNGCDGISGSPVASVLSSNQSRSNSSVGVLPGESVVMATAINGHHHPETLSKNLHINSHVEMPVYIVDSKTRVTYLKGKFLGKGGFAHVHLVTDLTTDRMYAGKIIPKSRITKRHHMEKITREVELQSTLEHENVVRFYHFFEDHLNVYIILETCDRMSLAHELKQRGHLTEEESRYYMWQLVEGVQYIHGQKVIHRDLKLGNMFLTKDFTIKIGDFGLATRHDPSIESKVTICGTPNYIAPEVLRKEGHVFASDIWSLGCSMYAMLVGFPPFETSSLKETYIKIMNTDYIIPDVISHEASLVIVRLLHPNAKERPTFDEICRFSFFVNHFSQHYTLTTTDGVTQTLRFPKINRAGGADQYRENLAIVVGLGDGIPCPQSQEIRRLSKAVSSVSIGKTRKANDYCKASTLKSDRLAKSQLSTKDISGNKKDSKFSCAIRLKITSVLCPDRLVLNKKHKNLSTSTLFHVLNTCIDNMPDDTVDNPPAVRGARVLFVVKWIDYSNRYGFGFQLSDHSVGVHFNDSSRMSFSPDKSRLEFLDIGGNVTPLTPSNVPAHLQEKVTLLRYFCQYMEENLTEGGDTKGMVWNRRNSPIPYMKRWLRTSRAIIMQLSTGTLQINFFQDHTKIIIGLEKNEYLVTYINEDRKAFTYKLIQMTNVGCDVHLRNRLLYALNVLGEFANLDSSVGSAH